MLSRTKSFSFYFAYQPLSRNQNLSAFLCLMHEERKVANNPQTYQRVKNTLAVCI